MGNSFLNLIVDRVPDGYTVPPFPSLGRQVYYLYHGHDIWRYTLLWTIIDVLGVHCVASAYAVALQTKTFKIVWVVPFVFGLIGALEAVIAGNVVGGL